MLLLVNLDDKNYTILTMIKLFSLLGHLVVLTQTLHMKQTASLCASQTGKKLITRDRLPTVGEANNVINNCQSWSIYLSDLSKGQCGWLATLTGHCYSLVHFVLQLLEIGMIQFVRQLPHIRFRSSLWNISSEYINLGLSWRCWWGPH